MLYQRIRDLREDADKSQEEIAKVIGTSQSYYAQYENGKRSIPFERMILLAKYYNVPLEKTVGIGDQTNDLPMICTAGLGVAVKNADDELKAKADYICDLTHEEDAVAYVIEKFGFTEE